jgi:hypothetical protein
MKERRKVLWCIDPLLSGDSVNNDRFWETARWTRSRGNEYAHNNRFTVRNGMFLHGPCWDVILKGKSQLLGVLHGSEDRTWARETEESPLLEAVAREQLVKTQQAGKGLVGVVAIC